MSKSGMKKLIVFGTFALILLIAGCVYFWNDFWILHVNRRVTIEVNGQPVPGGILEGRIYSAIVTRRDSGKQHSYLLSYAGDVDPSGNIGFVSDCQNWVSPRFPIFIVTPKFAECKASPEERGADWRWSLRYSDKGEKFVTKNGEVITVNRR